jgi:hypothetical protein
LNKNFRPVDRTPFPFYLFRRRTVHGSALAPVAGLALRYGAVALTTYAALRYPAQGPHDQRAEDALDDLLAEGAAIATAAGQANGSYRLRRNVRLGSNGPGIEIDAALLGRLRIRNAPRP